MSVTSYDPSNEVPAPTLELVASLIYIDRIADSFLERSTVAYNVPLTVKSPSIVPPSVLSLLLTDAIISEKLSLLLIVVLRDLRASISSESRSIILCTAFLTKAVVATLALASLVSGVGAVGVPVNSGESSLA